MSRDRDPQQRIWLSLGHGGKTAPKTTWRWWKKPNSEREWIISAPNGLAEFEQRGNTVFYKGVQVVTAKTQWLATWGAVGYFYAEVAPVSLPPPLCTTHVRGAE